MSEEDRPRTSGRASKLTASFRPLPVIVILSALSAPSRILMAAVVLSAFSAPSSLGADSLGADDGSDAEEALETMVLDLYLDDDGRALIVGYLRTDRLEELNFLQGSDLEYDQETGEIYALTDGLTSIRGEETRLEFEAAGPWDECHLAFYLPGDAAVSDVSSSEELAYSVTEVEGSMLVEAIGYGVEEAEVTIDYRLT
ncbi:MAG TPA: hypothetical protein PLZ42_05090 [Methanothrix sp.]|nr:hypothetical protein [Methanothrix sp.]